MKRPLEGILVLEFCQFLAGPSAGLKLADLGARVIKIERPVKGDACRQLAIKNLFVEGDSLLFHTINRNKESYAADLKNPEDLDLLRKLIGKADVMTHNFRPGVMEKIGLDYVSVQHINPKIIYAAVTGYGTAGPWAAKPGQDLLVQSVSGLTQLSGSRDEGPVPFGLSVTDIMCGNHLTQGIIAALIKRAKTNKSVLIEVSLLESALDVQFEVLTTYLNDGGQLPQRSAVKGSAHAYLSAPYGTYQTKDGYLALAMGDLNKISQLIGCDISAAYTSAAASFENRDALLLLLGKTFKTNTNAHWLSVLEPADVWCAAVLSYKEAVEMEVFKNQEIRQQLDLGNGRTIATTRAPIRVDGHKLYAAKAAPKIGADNERINKEFDLK
ncbi:MULTISPECIES: CaiB/BaiF CoA transferase family protein [Pedobacter]|uniref:L-carnitine dehydratase/bile acid-inducible protein F n=1 Tax=Pedobacter heparinus (strain ATCC 13125 / DSM 2366 / CIP 104194 / JCM 7457 / NBRC 12017 / NCIMB 9290 / NRRL B-14731 / HIM 762-3) TaxID=485917 RepID=C6Y129_PEDHD|nr:MULTISPECIES: CaiB/BaiF CoA-transferase family protein [Pedobacter]ACU04956.1 L-carnitine dehydratase/bile acid-inducible protein F [Pedobacter heparinus DSM 2366]MBB5437829.1 crotonobetainyl-CoA:carnitine CoA-transferase CaiB-like acyl-CoA transferase [Pedobacter sp. AK017]